MWGHCQLPSTRSRGISGAVKLALPTLNGNPDTYLAYLITQRGFLTGAAAVHALVADLQLRLFRLQPAALDFAHVQAPPTTCLLLCLLRAQGGTNMPDDTDDYNSGA